MRDDPNYLSRLIQFLDHIIKSSLLVSYFDTPAIQNPCPTKFTPFSTTHDVDAFCITLDADSNKNVSKVQTHSTFHNASYYKYGKSGSKCHFNFPRPHIEETYVDKCNSLYFKQNNVWVNPWNPAIASLLQSNHDITFITSANNALALIY